MSMEEISKKIVEQKKVYAAARAGAAVMDHNRTVVLASVKNSIEANIVNSGEKAPSEAKLERMAKDTQEYRDAISQHGRELKESIIAEAELEGLERSYEIAKINATA